MSNLHLWKTADKRLVVDYVYNLTHKDDTSYSKMMSIQNKIGVKRC